MFTKTKKIVFTATLLNLMLMQSLVADMLDYYSSAILPAIIAQKNSSPKFTTEMLADKSLFVYGFEEDGFGSRHLLVVNADGSQADIKSMNGNDVHAANIVLTINTDNNGYSTLSKEVPGMGSISHRLLKVLDDGSFIVIDISGSAQDIFDPTPQFYSTVELADNGEAALINYVNSQEFSAEILQANPWYVIGLSDLREGNVACNGLWTFNTDGTVDSTDLSETLEGFLTYSINGNTISYVHEGQTFNSPVAVGTNNWMVAGNDHYYKNYADAIAFANGIGEDCTDFFPIQ
ncbi:MAG: hypothetical protein U9R50_04495 [Campylobacterota bacterium]|nr:hypothetical protein [Campylobacterota bacterium]